MPMLYILPSQLSYGFLPYPLSPGLPISALVCFRFPYTAICIYFTWPHLYPAFEHVQPSAISLLLFCNCPTFCMIIHDLIHSHPVHFFFQLCWYMSLSHITPVVSLHFDQAIFILLFTSFSAPPLASNNACARKLESLHCLYLIFLCMACTRSVFLLLTLNP